MNIMISTDGRSTRLRGEATVTAHQPQARRESASNKEPA